VREALELHLPVWAKSKRHHAFVTISSAGRQGFETGLKGESD
jgi:hypothetical protein